MGILTLGNESIGYDDINATYEECMVEVFDQREIIQSMEDQINEYMDSVTDATETMSAMVSKEELYDDIVSKGDMNGSTESFVVGAIARDLETLGAGQQNVNCTFEEKDEEKKGILATVWEKILNVINSVKEFIIGMFGKLVGFFTNVSKAATKLRVHAEQLKKDKKKANNSTFKVTRGIDLLCSPYKDKADFKKFIKSENPENISVALDDKAIGDGSYVGTVSQTNFAFKKDKVFETLVEATKSVEKADQGSVGRTISWVRDNINFVDSGSLKEARNSTRDIFNKVLGVKYVDGTIFEASSKGLKLTTIESVGGDSDNDMEIKSKTIFQRLSTEKKDAVEITTPDLDQLISVLNTIVDGFDKLSKASSKYKKEYTGFKLPSPQIFADVFRAPENKKAGRTITTMSSLVQAQSKGLLTTCDNVGREWFKLCRSAIAQYK